MLGYVNVLLSCFVWSRPFRFAASEQGLLLASDVAARGLDIHKVQHVIHYHVPMNSDVRGGEGRGEEGRYAFNE